MYVIARSARRVVEGLPVIRSERRARVRARSIRPDVPEGGPGVERIPNDPDAAAVQALLERVRRGETEAIGALFGNFGDDVAGLCARMLGYGPDAEDAANETFLRARRGLDDYDEARPFRTWLLSIAAHHCIDRLRRRAREEKIFSPTEFDAEALPSPGPSPLRGELDAERRRTVTAAMDALPERYRAPLVLRYFVEQSYAEIGAALELSEAQVGMLLYRARRKLRDVLGPEEP